jgi:exopolysaccharide production protein ExoQ
MTGHPATQLGTGADSYPNKYLNAGQSPRRMAFRDRNKRGAAFSWSLLLPIVILLVLAITLRNDDNAEGFDWQLGMRVVGYSLAAVSVLLGLGMRKLPMDRLIFAWALVPIFITLSAVYALDGVFAFTAGLAHLVLLLFAWRMVTRHGHTPVALGIVICGLIIGALSILAYYAFPDIGRSTVEAYTADPGGRMRGVTPQPNTLGAVSAFTILLAVMYFRLFTGRQRVLAAAAMLMSAFCLVYSDSRTSIAALALCLLLWWLRRANVALNLFTIVAIALAACLVITFVPDVSAYLTRSDSGATDLSSLNGRSGIWDVAWESIYAHPLFGQGYGASRLILPIDDRLFGSAVNTHNVYMELLFSGGVVLFALFVLVVSASIFRSAMRGRTEALIALLFFLIRGAAEAAPFAGLPLFPALVFYTAVALCLSASDRGKIEDYVRRRPVNARPLTVVRGTAGRLSR